MEKNEGYGPSRIQRNDDVGNQYDDVVINIRD